MDLGIINETPNRYIRPRTFPIAIGHFMTQKTLPAKTKIPVTDLGPPLALCQVWGLSMRRALVVAVRREDSSRIGGHVAMGFPVHSSPAVFDDDFKRLEPDRYAFTVSAPLDRTDFQPHLICLLVDSAQTMRPAQAAVSGGGGIAPNRPPFLEIPKEDPPPERKA
jgi:uncharacterized protein (DUF169 family)